VFNSSKVINRYKMSHGKEKSYNERTGNSERVRNHTKKVGKQDCKEKIKEYNEVLLFADVEVLFCDRAYQLVQNAKREIVVIC
jgi:hypothetical protein